MAIAQGRGPQWLVTNKDVEPQAQAKGLQGTLGSPRHPQDQEKHWIFSRHSQDTTRYLHDFRT